VPTGKKPESECLFFKIFSLDVAGLLGVLLSPFTFLSLAELLVVVVSGSCIAPFGADRTLSDVLPLFEVSKPNPIFCFLRFF